MSLRIVLWRECLASCSIVRFGSAKSSGFIGTRATDMLRNFATISRSASSQASMALAPVLRSAMGAFYAFSQIDAFPAGLWTRVSRNRTVAINNPSLFLPWVPPARTANAPSSGFRSTGPGTRKVRGPFHLMVRGFVPFFLATVREQGRPAKTP